MMEEEWKDIKGYEGYYQVSNLGRVRSLDRIVITKDNRKLPIKGVVLHLFKNRNGYFQVQLCKGNKTKHHRIHRLVAENFLPRVLYKTDVNHIDGNKSNNRITNLEWCTKEENMQHSCYVLGNKPVNPSGKNARCNKPIAMIEASTGKVVKTYYSRNNAAEEIGYSTKYIGKAANCGFTIGSYKFKYIKKNEEDNH